MGFLKIRFLGLFLFFINILITNVSANTLAIDSPIKIGVYEDPPYISIDSKDKISGYYADFMKLLQKEENFEYELIVSNFSDGFKSLKDGTIDVMLGISFASERKEYIEFSKFKLAYESFTLLTKKDIPYGNFSELNDLTIGLIENYSSSKHALNFLERKGVKNLVPIYAKDLESLEKLLEEGTIDIMMGSSNRPTNYNLIYDFMATPTYIGANKNSTDILEFLDRQIEKIYLRNNKELITLYNKHFHYKESTKSIIIILIFTILVIVTLLILPKLKTYRCKNRIRYKMNTNKYLIYYQAIYNPKTDNIIGFESLLRLKGNDNSILPPSEFLPEIESNNMLFEISLWILEKIINDYNSIYKCTSKDNNDLYLSMNLSINEIENEYFVDKAIEILSNSNIGHNKICLEIVEKVKIDNVDILDRTIKKLKDAGFKIAIDDFGMEYSNLDILKKLDFDIVKLDKYFVDDLGSCQIKQEVIEFISKIATVTNKSLIIEGVEEKYQLDTIKLLQNNKLYIQGYFYSKPLPLEEILNT